MVLLLIELQLILLNFNFDKNSSKMVKLAMLLAFHNKPVLSSFSFQRKKYSSKKYERFVSFDYVIDQ